MSLTVKALVCIPHLSTKAWNILRDGYLTTTSCNPATSTFDFLGIRNGTDHSFRFYNAHETSAVESLAIILACGDAEFKVCQAFSCLRSVARNETPINHDFRPFSDVCRSYYHRRQSNPLCGGQLEGNARDQNSPNTNPADHVPGVPKTWAGILATTAGVVGDLAEDVYAGD